MDYEVYLILGGIIILIFSNYLVNRFNYKRRIMSAAALFFALLSQGIPEEEAFYKAFTVWNLNTKEEQERLLHTCTVLHDEASKYKMISTFVDKVFNE